MKTASLDNTQEKLLVATQPLETKKTDRSLPAEFGGTMLGYTWTINGKAYPNRDALVVKNGERVEIVISNITGMGHPVHKHDGFFQVVEIDGEPVSGACRDTVFVPPGSKMKIAFDANNPGIWAFHCHIPLPQRTRHVHRGEIRGHTDPILETRRGAQDAQGVTELSGRTATASITFFDHFVACPRTPCLLECAGLTALCSLPAPSMLESGVKPPHSKI
jgi:Putative multicopper oxidases